MPDKKDHKKVGTRTVVKAVKPVKSHTPKGAKDIIANASVKINTIKEQPFLVLCIDRDNDLYEKAKVSGPLIGRKQNLDGATKLAIADPEEPDANVMFYGIKLYDKMRAKGLSVEIVTLTGSKDLGYKSDFEISSQLDEIMSTINPKSAVLVTDGMSDEEIIPVIRSRILIDSTRVIFIKQAKELEKTYFVLIEKLKDPHYAKIVIGIPAFFILFLSLFAYFGYGWEVFGMLLGFYAILHLFKVDSWVYSIFKDFAISFDKIGWIGYVVAMALFLATIFSAYESYTYAAFLVPNIGEVKVIAYVISNISYLLGVSVLVFVLSKIIDAGYESKKFTMGKYGIYFGITLFTIIILKMIADWVFNPAPELAKMLDVTPNYVSFLSLLNALVVIIFLGYLLFILIKRWQVHMIEESNVIGRNVITSDGALLGTVSEFNLDIKSLIISNVYNKRNKFTISIDKIIDLGDNIIVRQ